ncbi:MAG: hypothetical protein IJI60_04160 [Bacilli bacterium]|nr:hypothetical protein [Bacilli bacterium]
MIPELSMLIDLYNNKKESVTFNTDNSEVLEFDDKTEEEYIISISMNKIEEYYYIFIFIEKDKNIVFKGICNKEKYDLSEKYKIIKNDLENLSLEKLLKKYENDIKINF